MQFYYTTCFKILKRFELVSAKSQPTGEAFGARQLAAALQRPAHFPLCMLADYPINLQFGSSSRMEIIIEVEGELAS
jgi:hypothetical protein